LAFNSFANSVHCIKKSAGLASQRNFKDLKLKQGKLLGPVF